MDCGGPAYKGLVCKQYDAFLRENIFTPEECEHIQLGRYKIAATLFGVSTDELDNSIFAKCARINLAEKHAGG